MSDEDWNSGFVRCLGLRLAGDLINDETERGEPVVGETLLLLFNGHWEPIDFTLPETKRGHIWDRLFDTADPQPESARFRAGAKYTLKDRSMALLATRPPEEASAIQPVPPATARAASKANSPRPSPTYGPRPDSRPRGMNRPDDLATRAASQNMRSSSRRQSARGIACPSRHTACNFTPASPFAMRSRSCPTCAIWESRTAYASPFLKAAAGSTHGYDVVDFATINPEIGSAADFDAWTSALAEHGMGQILDFVPNHMGVGTNENAWWNDVLENGPASRFASYFDIAWQGLQPRRPARTRAASRPGRAVRRRHRGREHFALRTTTGAFSIHYGDRRFPLDPASFGQVLGFGIDDCARAQRRIRSGGDRAQEHSHCHRQPARFAPPPAAEQLTERERETRVVKTRLETLMATSDAARGHLERGLGRIQRPAGRSRELRPARPASRATVLSAGLLAAWLPTRSITVAFLTSTSLAALRMERPRSSRRRTRWSCGGWPRDAPDGLRIDHPDGLYDPAAVFRASARTLSPGLHPAASLTKAGNGPGWPGLERPRAALEEAARRRPRATPGRVPAGRLCTPSPKKSSAPASRCKNHGPSPERPATSS